jgi:hypothetical protein
VRRNFAASFAVGAATAKGDSTMMKGGLLWLIGIPIPIIIVLYFLGVL